ncbi:MAG: hypothetical protein HUK21_06720 [Fibrobacteraceae bacterium]|nr:hypothetical protein [Fibrobacteraceae bacterium]
MIRGVSYFGVRSPKHVLSDMKKIKDAGFNAVLHTWSEEDLQYYKETMGQIVGDAADLGLMVYVNPWGVGRVFGGEAYSEITAKDHSLCQVAADGTKKIAACPNQPKFREYMHSWIEEVCKTKVSTIFWDEPHFYFEKGNLDNWSCTCDTCRQLYKNQFAQEMPTSPNGHPELTDKVKLFRENSLIDFLKEMTEHVHQLGKRNCVCMLPPWFPAGLDDWLKVAALPSVDEIASDPYWERGATEEWVRTHYRETADKLVSVAHTCHKDVQMWIKAYQIEEGREDDLAIAVEESLKAGIKNIFAWSYRGTETLSWLKSDNPEAVAKTYRKSLGLKF